MTRPEWMHASINVHEPEVVKAFQVFIPGQVTGTTAVELGKKSEGVVSTVSVALFLGNSEVVPFVADLVESLEKASPGFVGDLLDRITGPTERDCCASCDGHACE